VTRDLYPLLANVILVGHSNRPRRFLGLRFPYPCWREASACQALVKIAELVGILPTYSGKLATLSEPKDSQNNQPTAGEHGTFASIEGRGLHKIYLPEPRISGMDNKDSGVNCSPAQRLSYARCRSALLP
jgi:hypothetical protein